MWYFLKHGAVRGGHFQILCTRTHCVINWGVSAYSGQGQTTQSSCPPFCFVCSVSGMNAGNCLSVSLLKVYPLLIRTGGCRYLKVAGCGPARSKISRIESSRYLRFVTDLITGSLPYSQAALKTHVKELKEILFIPLHSFLCKVIICQDLIMGANSSHKHETKYPNLHVSKHPWQI